MRKIAIVHDFLYTYAGAERVLEQILELYPDADLFSLFDFLKDDQRRFVGGRKAKISFIQNLPFARKNHRWYFPLMPLAIEQLDLSAYDLVISSSYVAAKGVLTRPDQLHICYCHSPARFAWDLQGQYLETSGIAGGLMSLPTRLLLHYLRIWDTRSSNGVDVFATNSRFVGRRIEKTYRRESHVLYPPVQTEKFEAHQPREDFYLTACRQVPYKRVDLLIDAFNAMPDRKLVVVGTGPEHAKLKKRAGRNIEMLGFVPDDKLKDLMERTRAFVYGAEEDFGIVMVEAQAAGAPVIALCRGGAGEIVDVGRTGLLFDRQEPQLVIDAVRRFEASEAMDPAECRANAERFSVRKFRQAFEALVEREWTRFGGELKLSEPPSRGPIKARTAETSLGQHTVQPLPTAV